MKPREGIALLLALFTILMLQLLMAGVLALATLQKSLAQSRIATAHAQLAARAAPGLALEGWAATSAAQLPNGARVSGPTGTLSGARYHTAIERVSGSAFLIRAVGEVGDPRAPAAAATAGFLVHTIDPDPLAASFPAGLATGGGVSLSGESRIDGASGNQPPPGWSAARCAQLRPLAASSTAVLVPAADALVLDRGSAVVGFPAIAIGEVPAALPNGFHHLAARADHIVNGAVTPAAQNSHGRCAIDDSANWGAPLDPFDPCATFFPLIHAPGDLIVNGGSGQGMLLVAGDLTLSGATFYGVVVVLGRLTLREGAYVRGAVSTLNGSAPIQLHNSTISRCECSLRSALLLSEALTTPVPRAGRSWIPIY